MRAFVAFRDPSGNAIELALRPAHSGTRYQAAREAGITHFSHIGLCSTDPLRDEAFWTRICNARVSDRLGDAALLRIDSVHHSIALFPSSRPGIQHINHQVESSNDIMRSLHFFVRARGANRIRSGAAPDFIGTLPVLPGPGWDGVRVFERRPRDRRRAAVPRTSVPARAARFPPMGRQAAITEFQR